MDRMNKNLFAARGRLRLLLLHLGSEAALAGEEAPRPPWLPQPADLLLHALALLLQLPHPLFDVGDVLLPHRRVEIRVRFGLGQCGGADLGNDRVRAVATVSSRVVGHEEPSGYGSAEAELLEEEHLDHHPQRQPLVLRRVRGRLQRQLLAVHQPAQLLPLRLRQPRVRLHNKFMPMGSRKKT
jgi:hypothetical protein